MQQLPSRRLLFFCWVICVQAIALYLFTTGFFLTRFEVSELSSCNVLPHEYEQKSNLRTESLDESVTKKDKNGCWMDKKFDKIVFIVIDALRYDFAIKSDAKHARNAPFYLNHLPILATTIEEKPTKSMLFKFEADPPTMTMQRLKGLTTGSLPTFLDIKDNMHSSEIMEDNIIKQMHQQQKNIVFMGDDTWDSLYPSYFHRKFSFDSFVVKDLDTVDNGVIKNLFPELKKKDWNLLIGHFLGVDHVGHTHGPSSPFMRNKLRQMNDVLTRLIDAIEEDTLLVVLGDHGMSADGNHGGASDEETGAALFLHSKNIIYTWVTTQ
jgi:phosphatidylinositol glycan class O